MTISQEIGYKKRIQLTGALSMSGKITRAMKGWWNKKGKRERSSAEQKSQVSEHEEMDSE